MPKNKEKKSRRISLRIKKERQKKYMPQNKGRQIEEEYA